MQNSKFLIPAFVLAILLLVSCDVLEEEVVSGVTADTFYSIPEGFEAAVNASYAPLRQFYGSEDGANITVMGTDIITHGGHGGFHFMDQYEAALNSEVSSFWNIWRDFYRGINTANAAIRRAEDVQMSDAEKNAKIAEARFLRAHYYFILVQQFGPVHLTLEETVGVETEAERTPENEIFDAIISDLEFAIQHLPAEQSEFGRATEPAAKNMLGLVLLTRGYKDFAQGDDYSRAAAMFDDVINNYNFELLPDVMAPFNHDNEQNAEVIWSVQYTEDPLLNENSFFWSNGNHSHMHYRSWYEIHNDGLIRANDPGYGRPWQRYKPTPFALESYRPLDVDSRYTKFFQDVWYYNDEPTLPEGAAVGDTAVWVMNEFLTPEKIADIEARLPGVKAPEEGATGSLYTWHLDNQGDPWYMYGLMFPVLKKVDDWKRPSTNYEAGSRDYIVYRMADTYLLAAEAYLQAGDLNTAVERVNAVRRRAAWPGMEGQMEITAAELDLDFILDERGRELYGEQKRWFDLKRTGKLVERVKLYNSEGAPNIQDYHLLRPIPANQLTRTTNEYPQNPGY